MGFPADEWLVKVAVKAPDVKNTNKTVVYPEYALGSFISPRHIITSSQPVITEDYKWRMDPNKTTVLKKDYIKNTQNIIFPDTWMFSLIVTRNVSDRSLHYVELPKVRKAWLLEVPPVSMSLVYSSMLIELEKDVAGVEYPCFANATVPLEDKELVDIYGFQKVDMSKMAYWQVPISSVEAEKNKPHFQKILVPQFANHSLYGKGGPMVKDINSQTTILAIGASPGSLQNTNNVDYFHDLRGLSEELCDFSGICAIACITPSPAASPSTTIVTSTSPSSTPAPPTAISSTVNIPSSTQDRLTSEKTNGKKTTLVVSTPKQATTRKTLKEQAKVEENEVEYEYYYAKEKTVPKYITCKEGCFKGNGKNSVILVFFIFLSFLMIV